MIFSQEKKKKKNTFENPKTWRKNVILRNPILGVHKWEHKLGPQQLLKIVQQSVEHQKPKLEGRSQTEGHSFIMFIHNPSIEKFLVVQQWSGWSIVFLTLAHHIFLSLYNIRINHVSPRWGRLRETRGVAHCGLAIYI
jgi:hypothetical protein